MMEGTLHNFFYPKNILIAGASSKKGSIGYELTSTILKYGFKGELFLVNPSGAEILGLKSYGSIKELSVTPDLAIILVPKQFAEESINDCIDKGVKYFILITAGFRETGSEGEAAEKRIIDNIKSCGARLVGPNCMGLINTLDEVKLNATFVAESPETGNVGFLSQSGALGAAVLNSLRETGIRFAHFISVGNKADISENDVVEYWQNDERIGVITLYLESFSDGKKFLELISFAESRKPVILLKGGKTSAGMKAASSHTGALGSSERSVKAVMEQFGVLLADDINDLFNTAKGFENYLLPRGKRVAVVTNAGGPAILAVDSLEKKGLELSIFSEETKRLLKEIVHPEGSINNPVDLLPGGTASTYRRVIEILLNDNSVDSVVMIFVEPVMVNSMDVISEAALIKSSKPVLKVFMPLPEFWKLYKKEFPSGEPIFRNPENPSAILANMWKFAAKNKVAIRLQANEKVERIIFKQNNGFLGSEDVLKISKEYSLPLVKTISVLPEGIESVKASFPVVLKAGGEEVIHKTELKGVELNIRTSDELKTASKRMIQNFSDSGVKLEYFILQPQIKSNYEILIGGFRDPDFGPMVMFGTGGKYVEFYKDVSLKSAFLTEDDIYDMINSTVMGKLLSGVRGEKSVPLSEVKNIISSVAQMMLDYNNISELDLNPLLVAEDNTFHIVDIRIKAES